MTRLARAAFAATIGLAPAVAALPARAAECVRVVVDYGTFAGAPAGPNTHCTSSPSGATAAEVLAKRSSEVNSPPPRYSGNFLCAIDGYPGSGCGDHGTEPYWSLWLWVGGKWVYSSEGVATYTVRDADKDGHPDPIGFRYHEFETKRQPRANPGYPAPSPSRTVVPSPTRGTPSRTAAPTGGTGPTGGVTGEPGTGATDGTGATGVATGDPAGTPSSGAPSVTGTAASSAGADASGAALTTAPTTVSFPTREKPGGFPVGTLVVLLIGTGLVGVSAIRLRRSP